MSGISPKLPLNQTPIYGLALNETWKQVMRQNLKMLILTSPGERMMDPKFGVGLRQFLFKSNSSRTRGDISSKIQEQVRKYMPEVEIVSIDFSSQNGEEFLGSFEGSNGSNHVNLMISYEIPSAFVADSFSIKV